MHPLARVLVQAFRKQRGNALEASFVTFSVTVCGVWREDGRYLISGWDFHKKGVKNLEDNSVLCMS